MKVVILAGGMGTRISEESHLRPKPMIELDSMPILWHIMKSYSYYGYDDFVICCGYKGYMIKEYFANYYLYTSDITFDFKNNNDIIVHSNVAEPWKVTLVDTGINTMTGGRLKRVKKYIGEDDFMLTYGDGVCDIDIRKIEQFHKSHGKIATLTAIQPGGKFGVLSMEEDGNIKNFVEKSKEDGGWINGGYMMFKPDIFDYIVDDDTILERHPFEKLARQDQLMAYKYYGFWQCMDTLRDKIYLEELLKTDKAPWKVW